MHIYIFKRETLEIEDIYTRNICIILISYQSQIQLKAYGYRFAKLVITPFVDATVQIMRKEKSAKCNNLHLGNQEGIKLSVCSNISVLCRVHLVAMQGHIYNLLS